MICPNCGTAGDGKRFCTRCGTELLPARAPTLPASDISPPPVLSTPPSSGALAGRTLDQRYYLESRIGVGGMGTVYRARRLLIGDAVAVKVLHPEQVADSQSVERFRREAQTAARLKHPNVVTVYDFGVSKEGLNYLVMELVGGESLARLIEQQGTLTETDSAEIIRQVCAALDEAHGQGVVHRDIKPENILVQTAPGGMQVKVLDFGIAALRDTSASRLTRTGSLVGTPHYMSPEHCLGEELDGRADIYSLGIVLFEMLTGVMPFDSPTPTAIIVKHVNQPPPPPRSVNPNISPAVEAVVLRALEKRREARPQTAGELARELIAAVNRTGVASPRHVVVAPPGGITPIPVITPPAERIASVPSSSAATLLDGAPVFGGAYAKPGSSRYTPLLIFGALLLLAGVVAGGLWWYLQKGSNEQVATTSDSAGGSQQASTVSGQPTAPDRNATVSPSTSLAVTKSPPSAHLWELIPDQTSGVADAADALGAANQQVAVIEPGGQLALNYREGQFFGDGHGADLRVYGSEQEQVSYLIFVRDNPTDGWERIDVNRKGFPQGMAGHDIGHHGVSRARQVMIRNTGNAGLSIDAIAVAYKDKANSESGAHKHH